MGFDETTSKTTRPDVATVTPGHDRAHEHDTADQDAPEPLSLVGIQTRKRPDIDGLLQVPEKLHHTQTDKPRTGHPTVGAGTPYSDIIRDRYKDEIPFHLGERPIRGDVAPPLPPLPSPLDIPSTAVPSVKMENVGASAPFAQHMRDQIDSLPAPVRKLLADKQIVVVITDKMLDAAPDLKDEHPRGWPPNTTTANEDGCFRPDKREVLVAETFLDKDGKQTTSDRSEGVIRHETGHAVDAALDNYSQGDAFKAAYNKDVAAMPADVQKKLEYLLQADGAGAQETFAELFAAIHGGSANDSQTALILQNFPTATNLIRQKLASLTP